MRLFIVTLLCLLAIGCRSNPRVDRQTALLRAEILDLEDKYYLLKSKYDGVLTQIGDGEIVGDAYYEGEVVYEGDVIYDDRLQDPAGLNSMVTAPGNASPSREPSSGVRSIVQPPEAGEAIESRTPRPDTSVPRNSEPLPVPKLESDQSKLLLNPPGMQSSSDIEISFPHVINAAEEITEIVINQTTTRGRDVDGIPGDEGIDLLIQPKTATGQVEYQSGELTISVIDSAESPERQRIGLWKFLPEEAKLFFANDEMGNRGILLHLPWDQSTPVNAKLMLDVRFRTSDGRELKTSGRLRIDPPAAGYSARDPKVAAWTRQDSRWIPEPDTTMKSDGGADWRRHSTSPEDHTSASRPLSTDQPRRMIPAIPAKAELKRPVWRPIR